jgi:transposase-like protein
VKERFVPKLYSPEFRRGVIELCRSGRRPREIAEEVGVAEATIYRWIAELELTLRLRRSLRSLRSRKGGVVSAQKDLPGD